MVLPKSIGVMILPSVNLFPHAILPLFIFEPRYRRMLKTALESHRLFCIAMQKPDCDEIMPAEVAGVGLIRAAVENPDGTSNMILQGTTRVRLGRVLRKRPYRVQCIQALEPEAPDLTRLDALAGKVRELVGERFRRGLPGVFKFLGTAGGPLSDGALGPAGDIVRSLSDIQDPGMLADLVSCTLLPDPQQRQLMLETVDLEQRLQFLIAFLLRDLQGEGGAG